MGYMKEATEPRLIRADVSYNQQDVTATPARESDVPAALGLLRMDLEDLSRTLRGLFNRLEPALHDQKPVPASQAQESAGMCPLSRELHIIRNTIRDLQEQTAEVHSRIEL